MRRRSVDLGAGWGVWEKRKRKEEGEGRVKVDDEGPFILFPGPPGGQHADIS